MAAIELGIDVEPLVVRLYKDADFVSTLVNKDADWPAGTQIYVWFPRTDTRWDAYIVGPNAVWNIDKALTNVRLNREATELRIVTDGAEQVWAAGMVNRAGD